MVISLTGLPGSGKSTVGRELASQLGWDFVDLDEYVVSREGRSIPDMFSEGEAVFRAAEEAALLEILDRADEEAALLDILDRADAVPSASSGDLVPSASSGNLVSSASSGNLVLALGGGTICYEAAAEGIYSRDDRPAPGQRAREAVLKRTTCFWLRVDPATALARIPDPSSRPLLAGEAGKAVDRQSSLEAMRRLLTSRERFYRLAHFHIPCDDLSPDEAAASIITLLDL